MPITIKDIAKKANVSPSTVSRALNDHPRISTETKKQIQALAKSMRYIPSQAARNLVTQQSATIGVAVADYLDPFYVSLLASIEDVAFANNYDLFVSSFYRDRQREEKLFVSFFEKRLAGIIVAGSLIDEGYLSQENSSIPVVLINCFSYPFSVSADKLAGAIMVLEYLIDLGHRRIAYVSLGKPVNTEFLRLQGYRSVLRKHNIPIDESLIVQGDGGVIGGIKAVSQLMDLPEKPSAIFCFNDMTAIGVLNALQKQGYQVPRDFFVVGFDDLGIAAYYHPTLTTHLPTRTSGCRGAAQSHSGQWRGQFRDFRTRNDCPRFDNSSQEIEYKKRRWFHKITGQCNPSYIQTKTQVISIKFIGEINHAHQKIAYSLC